MDRNEFHEFSLKTPDGKTQHGLPFRTSGLSRIGRVVVQPGADYEQEVVLDEWFPFASIGTYTLTVQPRGRIDIEGAQSVQSPVFTTEVEIRPRDVEHLKALCSNLANQVEAAANPEAARQPALILSYIRDPVAVPYLSQVLLARKQAEYIAVAGLERIGNDEAIQVLVSALENPNDDIATSARMALSTLEERVSDPALKRKVREAMSKTRVQPT